ncbi:hypothetical protein M153_497000765 [Pseudoloma neurophilia]|uniref:Uncharacterized protein n=1 Tax=Pseudoloma neurophilia TaxID=146866 RepID=A0A0R0M4A2_9MICR|nr:hypothetical protein M153_497000765 [Pseudoloma neurophilia]
MKNIFSLDLHSWLPKRANCCLLTFHFFKPRKDGFSEIYPVIDCCKNRSFFRTFNSYRKFTENDTKYCAEYFK